jgi:RNA polymerase sigma factor (sigma-70 family)
MEPTDDSALLRQYAENNSDEAFAALVSRHINLVYSVALRQVGNAHAAEEITQAVFIILAKKAAQLRHDKALGSWLFQATRLTANNFIRSESRRCHREEEAFMQSILNESETEVWPKIAPLLDSAVAGLREKDRQAIVLRFYEGRNLREVGMALGASESAAEKRVSRALEKLRKFFTKRGVSSTTGIIAGTISANSVQAAPVALAKSVTAVALTKGAAASASTLTLIKGALKIMAWTKLKTTIVAGVIIALAAGTTTVAVKRLSAPFDPWEKADNLDAEFRQVLMNDMGADNANRAEANALANAADNGNVKAAKAIAEKARKEQNDIDDVFNRYAKKAPAGVLIRPTHFSQGQGGSTRHGRDLMVEKLQPFTEMLAIAYGKPNGQLYPLARMILPQDLPPGQFDFLVNVPDQGLERFQGQIKIQFGLVAHVETLKTNVLALRVKNPAAPGLRPGEQPGIVGQAFFGSAALADALENYFIKQPVVDETKLTGIEHAFVVPFKAAGADSVKQSLLDEYGFELVPTNMPIEMLVVEKVQ